MTTSAEFVTASDGIETVGAVSLALRVDLADAVRSELTGAGLPVGDESDAGFAGAEAEVDLGDDAATRRTDVIGNAMRDSMITILCAAGFEASPSDDDMRPLALRVHPRRGTS